MSSVAIPTAQEVRDRLEQMVGPLREQEQLVASEIETIQTRLTELRAVHTDLKRAIRSITGEPATNTNGEVRKKPLKAKSSGAKSISEHALEQVYDWLVDHKDEYPDGFIATPICRAHVVPGASGQSRLSLAMKILHEQGRLLLDRLDGTSKVYKLP